VITDYRHLAQLQFGTPGVQSGIGMRSFETAWWLGTIGVREETAAAAAPAKTIDMAKMRMASFIFSYPFKFELAENSIYSA
jgi:hypothetical protein